jgi:hypothetical protein
MTRKTVFEKWSCRVAAIFGAGIFIGILVGHSSSSRGYEIASVIILQSSLLVLFLLSMRRLVGAFSLRYLTIPAFFFLFYVLRIYLPSTLVFFQQGESRDYRYLFAVYSVLLTVPAGIMCANGLFRFDKREIRTYLSKRVEREKHGFHLKVLFGILLLFSVGLMLVYMRKVETIPLFYMMKHPGQYAILTQLREESFKLLQVTPMLKYLFSWLRGLLFPFLIILSLGMFWQCKERVWFAYLVIALVFGSLYAGMSLAKAPVAAIFLTIFIFACVYRKITISLKFSLLFIFLLLAFPILVIFMVSPSSMDGASTTRLITFFPTVLWAIGRRLFYMPAYVLYYYFEVFPAEVGYLWGASVGKSALLFRKEHFETASYVFRYIYPHGNPNGLANAAFVGNLHADFGVVGVILGGLLTGVLLQSLQIHFMRNPKTVLNLSAYAFLIYAFTMLDSTALPIILLTNGVIMAFVLLWTIVVGRGFLGTLMPGRAPSEGCYLAGFGPGVDVV